MLLKKDIDRLVLSLFRHLSDAVYFPETSVVSDYIDIIQFADRRLNGRSNIRTLGHVALDGQCIRLALVVQLRARLLSVFKIYIGGGDIGFLIEQSSAMPLPIPCAAPVTMAVSLTSLTTYEND
jgi:hypothetical protein